MKQFINDIRENIVVKGVKDITSVSMYKNKDNFEIEDNSYVQKEEWVLNTSGINLLTIMNMRNVDFTRTISNDVYEVYELLGIESA